MKGDALFISIIAVLLLIGPAFGEVIGQSDIEVQALANPIIERVLTGINTNNYSVFSQDFDIGFKESFTQAIFTTMQSTVLEKLGLAGVRTYVGFLNQIKTKRTVVTYKVRYAIDNKDLLFHLVLSKRGADQVVVVGLP